MRMKNMINQEEYSNITYYSNNITSNEASKNNYYNFLVIF